MRKYIQKDSDRRSFVKKQEDKRISLKSLQQNKLVPSKLRFFIFTQISKIKRNGSPVKVMNRCVLTGRSRGVHRYFKISRIMIRQLAAQGLLAGVKKYSW